MFGKVEKTHTRYIHTIAVNYKLIIINYTLFVIKLKLWKSFKIDTTYKYT